MPKSQPKSNKITKTSEDKEKVLTIGEPIEFKLGDRVKHVAKDYHRPDLLSIKEQSGYKSFKRMERERRLKESKEKKSKESEDDSVESIIHEEIKWRNEMRAEKKQRASDKQTKAKLKEFKFSDKTIIKREDILEHWGKAKDEDGKFEEYLTEFHTASCENNLMEEED